jgi:hypothetical protein
VDSAAPANTSPMLEYSTSPLPSDVLDQLAALLRGVNRKSGACTTDSTKDSVCKVKLDGLVDSGNCRDGCHRAERGHRIRQRSAGPNHFSFQVDAAPTLPSAITGLQFDRQSVAAGSSYSANVSGSSVLTSQYSLMFGLPRREVALPLLSRIGKRESQRITLFLLVHLREVGR